MGRKQYLYHVTTKENVKSNLRNGLNRQMAPVVSLSGKPTSRWRPGLEVLRVRITGLKGEMHTWLPESDEITYWGDINPERISVYTDRLPRRFVQNWEKNHLRPTNMSGAKCDPCKPTQPECGNCDYGKDE